MSVKGAIRPPKESERYFALLRVDTVNGRPPKAIHELVNFEDLTPLHPEERFLLETAPDRDRDAGSSTWWPRSARASVP
jgi:transcription termination factor Rho